MSLRLGWVATLLMCTGLIGCTNNVDNSSTGVSAGGTASANAAPGDGNGASSSSQPAAVEGGAVALAGSNTVIGFKGTKPDGTVHFGGFSELTGSVEVDQDTNAPTKIAVEINTESLWSDNERLTGHLKSPDFFNAAEQPKIAFASTSIEAGDAGGLTINGELTLLATTKPISFPATVNVSDEGFTLTAEFSIDRTEFGMNYGEGQIDNQVGLAVSVGTGAGSAAATAAAGGRGGQGRGGRGGGGRGGFDPARMFADRDADGDGKLSGDELSERMRENLESIDTDGDGAVSQSELEERMRQFGGGRRGGEGGGGGGGQSERPQRPTAADSDESAN